ncbi:DegV family protein [Lysobacter fragariae]
MRIGIVVDSPCDLPEQYLQANNIPILPTTVRMGAASIADYRNPEATLQFLHTHLAERGWEAESSPFSVDQIRDLFLTKLVIDYDFVFCLTITKTRSLIFDNAQQASFAILNEYKPIRANAGNNTPFALRVIDTQNLFAAQTILPVEAVRLRAAGENAPKIRARLENLAQLTQGFLIPRDLNYMRERTRIRGDRSVSFLAAKIGTAFDIKPILHCSRGETGPVGKVKNFDHAAQKLFEHATRRIERGDLATPTLGVSFGGELEELRALPGYSTLRQACAVNHVEMIESMMALTSMVNIGKGGLALGYAASTDKIEL